MCPRRPVPYASVRMNHFTRIGITAGHRGGRRRDRARRGTRGDAQGARQDDRGPLRRRRPQALPALRGRPARGRRSSTSTAPSTTARAARCSAGVRAGAARARQHRICVYDRAESRQERQGRRPDRRQATRDRPPHAAAQGRVKPPYVLLGASFGGLVALRLRGHLSRSEVKGMLLLDAGFPTELKLEPLFPRERAPHARLVEGPRREDRRARRLRATPTASLPQQPKIPVTYLLAMPYDVARAVSPAYDAVIMKTMADYVHSFHPGMIKRVKSDALDGERDPRPRRAGSSTCWRRGSAKR